MNQAGRNELPSISSPSDCLPRLESARCPKANCPPIGGATKNSKAVFERVTSASGERRSYRKFCAGGTRPKRLDDPACICGLLPMQREPWLDRDRVMIRVDGIRTHGRTGFAALDPTEEYFSRVDGEQCRIGSHHVGRGHAPASAGAPARFVRPSHPLRTAVRRSRPARLDQGRAYGVTSRQV